MKKKQSRNFNPKERYGDEEEDCAIYGIQWSKNKIVDSCACERS